MITKLLLFALTMWALWIPSRHALHMYQQNRYENGRFAKWIRTSVHDQVSSCIIPLAIVLISIVVSLFQVTIWPFVCVQIVMALYHRAMEKGKQYIKPLVVTARVKRQIAVLVILEVLALWLILAFVPACFSYGLMIAAGYFLPWILLFAVGWITAPIEHGVQQSYLNDAKKILNSHTGLIKIGITGSYGKTTTKNIMQAVLSEKYNTLMTPASYNTPMGITRTIREMLKPIHQVFVCEMGADHVGDITELMNFVHPSIGVVTSIGPQHLNTFGSQENIIKEKMQMAEKLPADGVAILNYDNEFIRNYHIANPVKVISYGIACQQADYHAEDISYSASGSSFVIVHGNERIPVQTKLLGELNILNILAAAACARYLNVSWEAIAAGCKNMKQVEHRLELKRINGFRFIDDAFNANPSGSAMALEVLGMMPGRRIIVTPGMIDLGAKQDEINRSFGQKMKGKADWVVLVGEAQTKPILAGLQDVDFDMSHVVVLAKEKEAFNWVWANASREDTILLENDLPDAFNR